MEMLDKIEIETPSWLDGEAEVVYVSEVEAVYLFHLLELAAVKRLQVGQTSCRTTSHANGCI